MELKEILEELDLNIKEDATKEDIMSEIRAKYIARELVTEDEEIVNKVFGRQAGTYETILKRNLKAFGLTDDELKDFSLKKLKENEDKYFASIAEKHRSTVEELKKAAAQGNDKKVEELTKKLEGLEEKNTSLSTMLQEKEQEFEENRKNFNNEIKNFQINHTLDQIKSKFPLSDSVDEYKKKGFEVTFREKYKVDLDEKKQIAIYDHDGKPIQNEKKSGFATFEEVYERELIEANMLKRNNTDPKAQVVKQTEKDNKDQKFYINTANRVPIAE